MKPYIEYCIQIDAFYTLIAEYCTLCNKACIFLSL